MERNVAVKMATKQLEQAGIENARIDARSLFSFVTGLTRTELLFYGDVMLTGEQEQRYFEVIKKRAEHIPLQYLTGKQDFMGLSFQVSPAVLIPRQDTECLVEEVIKYSRGKSILDMCTGSGCIAISIAKLGAPTRVEAADLSEAALELAKMNAMALEAEVKFSQGDLYEAISGRFDLIVSNPPYIETKQIETLMPEVRMHEPRMALDGEADGLAFYRRLIQGAEEHLEPKGQIFFEIGCEQAAAVSALLAEAGFCNIKVCKDYAGLDRVISAQLS